MKKIILVVVLASIVVPLQAQHTHYVNPMIGTAKSGHVYPGATVPFGMVQLSPDNGTQGWNWCSGYNYADTVIKGFSHTHLSGTGVGDLYDILMMPAVIAKPTARYTSAFSHTDEHAEPGYYSVLLKSFGIQAELTATARAGFHRYTFPESRNAKIIIDLGHHLNSDRPVETNITRITPTLIEGWRFSTGWAKKQRVYFAARFSARPAQILLGNDTLLQKNKRSITQKGAKAVLEFSTKKDEQILVKVGISGVSAEGALKNLDAEIPSWNFDSVRTAARVLWEHELSKAEVTSADSSLKTVFYTALYHAMLAPVIYNDVDGRYRGGDDSVHASERGRTNYTIFSLWDTFRAEHPLFTILEPERVDDFVRSLLAFKRETGYLPVWTLHANETMCMIGYHSVPVIADAYLKGFRGFDTAEAFDAMIHSAMSDRQGLKWYRQYGFVPADSEGESVSKTLEYAYDDWCIAQMAHAMGNESAYKEYFRRSQSYRNLFDSSTLFMRGKLSTGAWRTPFDPLEVDHRKNDYTEGNAWQYSLFVPQDVDGLFAMMGGKKAAVQWLDSLFETKEQLRGTHISPDISGMIGQYAHGNEPSHHVAYLYALAGEPAKTEARVSQIMRTLYMDKPDGLCGNDDCGQMSAWYIFSALGFYPVNPASQQYVLGTPLFDKAVLHVPGGKTFAVERKNFSALNTHVGAVFLNGERLTRPYITHAEMMNGGVLVFEMTDRPVQSGSTEER